MENIYFEVQGIVRVTLIQECGANLIVEDESGTRLSLPASRCTVADQTAAAMADSFPARAASLAACDRALAEIDALADQFTGADMGAEMAAVEGFDHSQQVARVGHEVFTAIGEGVIKWVTETPGGWVYGIQALGCPDCRPQLLMGDEFTAIPLPSAGYRVGDAHDNGEG